MDNFDFTQFVTFDSTLPYQMIKDTVLKTFLIRGFTVIDFENIEEVKKDYFSSYWRKYSFELKMDDFLGGFMEWEIRDNIPIKVKAFIDDISEILTLSTWDLRVIICSFAEKEKTCNEYVCTKRDDMYGELFKMSPYSLVCPDNLIIKIMEEI